MIKKIIFDVDDTLIDWKKEYVQMYIGGALDFFKIKHSPDLCEEIEKKIMEYGKQTKKFCRAELTQYLNEHMNLNLPSNFMNVALDIVTNCVPEKLDNDDVETLKYLSCKYELVVLTNWFEIPQTIRLDKLGILKYFTHIYGSDDVVAKPYAGSFKTAMGTCQKHECIMVGDSIRADIMGALSNGIQAVHMNKKCEPCVQGAIEIKKLSDLMKIF